MGLTRFFSWFLLVPYFAVKSLNRAPLFPGPGHRKLANRAKAASVVAPIVWVPIIGLISSFGESRRLVSGWSPFWVTMSTYVPTVLLTMKILSGKREDRLWFDYQSMPLWKRRAYGFSTLAAALVGVIALIFLSPTTPSPHPMNLHCKGAATEMTADGCSVQ